MDRTRWPARSKIPVARPGLKFIYTAILLTGMFFYFGWMVFALLFAGAGLFVTWFFRDPDRIPPEDENGLVSPADGKIIFAEIISENDYVAGSCLKISIFMNVFNVHVNRAPFDGTIEKVQYYPGRFFNASFDKASTQNERNALIMKTEDGQRFAVVQIAGLIARRIVNCVVPGDRLKKGDRYGMIQFGSRLDLYLPTGFKKSVRVGQKVAAGNTILGYMQQNLINE